MTIEGLQNICSKFPGFNTDIKWENDLCFLVADKIFLMASLDQVPVAASFKVTDEEFDEISARDGFKPAPYLARNKWVYVDDINVLSIKEWEFYINQSYKLISSRLTKKKQKELGLI